jgi:hypothetical protein
MTLDDQAQLAEGFIADYESAREAYTMAVKGEMLLLAEKPGKKATAIARLMTEPNPSGKNGALHSATSAEAIAETDRDYAAHLLNLRTQVAVKLRAETTAEAAWLRASLAITLTKSMAGVS